MRHRHLILVPVVLGLVAACSSPTQPTTTASLAAAATSPTAGTQTTVRLLAHDSFVVSKDLLADFAARTGITIEVVTGGDAGTMVSGAVLAAGSPSADVMFGADNTLVTRAVDAGVFVPYSSPELTALAPEFRGDTADGLVTPIDYGDVCVNIDDEYFASAGVNAPTTLDALTDPAYRDLLVVEDPAASSPGLAFLLATIARYGEAWPAYWTALKDNGVKVAASWTDAYLGDFTMGGAEGDRPLVVSYATSPPAEIVYATEPKPTRPSTSVLTDGCYRQVEYAGVLAGTANEQAARQVVDWLLSEQVQADVPMSMFVFPTRDGIALPPVFDQFAADVPQPLQLPAQDVTANLPTWLDQWNSVMGR